MNQRNDPMNIILSSLLNSILMWFGLVWFYDSGVSVKSDESVDSFLCGTKKEPSGFGGSYVWSYDSG
jgi:hypothetical protein